MRSRQNLVDLASEISRTAAADCGAVAYIPKLMTAVSLPSREPTSNEYIRVNGTRRLVMLAPTDIGLPYGCYPRLLICWITTVAKRTNNREVYLGRSLAEFMRNVGKRNTGGANGSIRALRDQAKKLFATSISWIAESENDWSISTVKIAQDASIIWNISGGSEWRSYLILEDGFYADIQKNAVPVDWRVMAACSHYPLAMDVYCWLTSRYFHLRRTTVIRWDQLQAQFGNRFARESHFREKFVLALHRVQLFYPESQFRVLEIGVLLAPSPPHVLPVPKVKRRENNEHGCVYL